MERRTSDLVFWLSDNYLSNDNEKETKLKKIQDSAKFITDHSQLELKLLESVFDITTAKELYEEYIEMVMNESDSDTESECSYSDSDTDSDSDNEYTDNYINVVFEKSQVSGDWMINSDKYTYKVTMTRIEKPTTQTQKTEVNLMEELKV